MRSISILVITRNDKSRNFIINEMSHHEDLQIIGIENNEANIIIKSEQSKPDVLIIDIQPSGMDGIELAPIIHRRSPLTSIIMMCDRDENDYAGMALRSGISGYLLRETDMNKLVPAVKIVYLGGYFISASIIRKSLSTISFFRHYPVQFSGDADYPVFSPKELIIIANIAQGIPDEKIAEDLNYSPGTIKNCVTAIKNKTKLKNRMQIVLYSLFYGHINIDQLNTEKSNRHILNNGIKLEK